MAVIWQTKSTPAIMNVSILDQYIIDLLHIPGQQREFIFELLQAFSNDDSVTSN
jgi:hypothetical protein